MVGFARMARVLMLALVLLVGCDRGIEATQDNLSHFATVTSELRRDARELELLAKKVAAVQAKLERRRAEISEHVYSDEHEQQRDELLAQLQPPTEQPPTTSGEGETSTTSTAREVSSEALVGVIALHEQLFMPLRVFDDSLARDIDYGWWIEELGLTSADTGSVAGDMQDEHRREITDCRTHMDPQSRAAACRMLLDNHLSASFFAQVKQQWLADLDSEIQRLGLIQIQFEAEADDRRASADKVMAAYGSSFDGLIIWGFPALIIAVLVIVLVEGRRRKTGGHAQPDTLAVVTVLLLVSAIIILGLGGKIQPEALGTLIGGISGYVLGKGAQLLGGESKPVEAKPVEAKQAEVVQSKPSQIEPGEPEPIKPEPSEADAKVAEPARSVAGLAPKTGDAAAKV